MIHDWLRSGEYLHPYRFAIANYTQYPAFNIPYHPPVYPAALGLTFLITGVSYEAARAFIAVAFAIACVCFFAILRRSRTGTLAATAGTLALATNPEMVHWARDTMSEIPSLALILMATLLYLRWIDEQERPVWLSASFVVAALAFLSRVTVAAAVPAWLMFGAARLGIRRLLRPRLVLTVALCLIGGLAWVWVVRQFATYEVNADGRGGGLRAPDIASLRTVLPQLMPPMAWLAAGLGALVSVTAARASSTARFWHAWLISWIALYLLVPSAPQPRYLLPAVPGLVALATLLFHESLSTWMSRFVAPVIFAAMIATNLVEAARLPRGLVGYDAVAVTLSKLSRPGNILLACWHDQELIFRYRAHAPTSSRHLLRADRTLAIRLADYANFKTKRLATTPAEVLDIIRRGRVRYLVTIEGGEGSEDSTVTTEEMVLAAKVARESGAFRLVDQAQVIDGMTFSPKATAIVWEYTGELPEGPSDLPVIIPTMGVTLDPSPDDR